MSKRKPITDLDNILNPGRMIPDSPDPVVAPAPVSKPQDVPQTVPSKPKSPRKQKKQKKDKETYYLPIELIERLEGSVPDVRRFTRGKTAYKATKSDLVGALLSYALDDLEQYSENSRVVAILIDLLNAKGAK